MFKLSISKIFPLYPTKVYLEFLVENLKELSLPKPTLYIFVERSESESNLQWELLTPQGIDSFFYIDPTPQLLSLWRTLSYRAYVEIKGIRYYSEPISVKHLLTKEMFLRRRKILYDEELVLRKLTGLKIAILKRRHYGPRCTKCWDPNTNSVTLSGCPICFGTGFLNPYYPPFITYGSRVIKIKQVDEHNTESTNETDYTKMQILDYPTVTPQDVVVDIEINDRYKVDAVEQTEMRHEIVHQELSLTKLSRTEPEYKIVLDNRLLSIPSTISL